MADTKVSALAAESSPATGDAFYIVTDEGGGTYNSKKVLLEVAMDYANDRVQTLTNKTIAAANNTLTIASTDLSDTAALTYNADTDVSGNGWVVDEDQMTSDLDTKVPTQQSVKYYCDTYFASIDSVRDIDTKTDAYQLVQADGGKIIEMNSALEKTITIPANATTAITTDTVVTIVRYGAGVVNITAAAGVTLNGTSENTVNVTSQYGAATLYKRGTNEWVAIGDVS